MMWKQWIVLIMVVLWALPVYGEDQVFKLKATKVWTEDEARTEAFKNVQLRRDLSPFPAFDPFRLQHKQAIAMGEEKVGDRSVTVFSNGFYGVTQLCALENYFYLPTGQLAAVQFNTYPNYTDQSCPETPYPHKSYKYLFPTAELVSVTINVSDNESYTFYPDGRLMSHWRGDQCTLANGESCGSRSRVE